MCFEADACFDGVGGGPMGQFVWPQTYSSTLEVESIAFVRQASAYQRDSCGSRSRKCGVRLGSRCPVRELLTPQSFEVGQKVPEGIIVTCSFLIMKSLCLSAVSSLRLLCLPTFLDD